MKIGNFDKEFAFLKKNSNNKINKLLTQMVLLFVKIQLFTLINSYLCNDSLQKDEKSSSNKRNLMQRARYSN